MSEETTPTKGRRRSPAELRAFHLAEAARAEQREKDDVLRLASDAHDTLAEAMSLEAHKPQAQAFTQASNILKAIIAAYTPKKP